MTLNHTPVDTTRVTTSDATLIADSARQPNVFGQVFERHHARVRRYVASRVGPQAADDVVAETFVTAFKIRRAFDAELGDDARSWLLGIATNVIARHRAAERRWFAECAAHEGVHNASTPFEGIVDDRTDAAPVARRLAAALRRIPARERDALLLVALGDLSYEEAAAALDIPIGTVRSRVSRGRTRLITRIEETS